ncbi:GDSL esterase/lipase CPRD49 [Hibiscus syriacus]|uniref:GDSL esterase/lipase CPRD49 n=1 Tax=Hibiscus syriacus TaxID=106335 RepID=A0A6A2ZLK9_HIBSY|nr:GDSL esterase/lipase CPRD49-like [Hibiscus syriacus]KAE8692891.1 GDSL esterase/lipase CPRD49 [Hibiscus syriacus]
MSGTGRPLFVLFGSSIVQFSFSNEGWGSILAHTYVRKADIILRGYAGWNSRRALEVLTKVFPQDGVVQPSLVIVYFGGNDSIEPHPSGLGPHVPLLEYVNNMKKIAMHLQGLSEKTRVMFLTTPPVNEEQIHEILGISGRTNEGSRVYSEACLKLCRELGVKCVDLWTAIQQRDGWMTTCFTDGIHFSSEGNKLVAKEILKAIEEADWEPSLCSTSLPIEFGEDSIYDLINQDGKTVNVSDLEFPQPAKL